MEEVKTIRRQYNSKGVLVNTDFGQTEYQLSLPTCLTREEWAIYYSPIPQISVNLLTKPSGKLKER
jgi:hypothetical protein